VIQFDPDGVLAQQIRDINRSIEQVGDGFVAVYGEWAHQTNEELRLAIQRVGAALREAQHARDS
jgi:hypothetical protein